MRIKREELLQQLEAVQPALSTKGDTIEQSSSLVFKGNYVWAYNDTLCARQRCNIGVQGAVQAKQLLDLLRKLTEDELEIEQGEGELRINGKRRSAGVRMEADILLPLEQVETPDKNSWKDLHPDFGDAVSIVQECAAKDDARQDLVCVHIHPNWVEACDNTQMARYRLKTGVAEPFLVKQECLKHVVGFGMTKFAETTGWVHFKNPTGLMLSARRYVETYPDLTKFLDIKGTPAILPKGLQEAVAKAEIFSADNADSNRVFVELRPGKLRIKGEGVTGWYKEYKKLQRYDGQKAFGFCISPKLLVELVKRHNECELTADQLKVNGGKFVYCCCLEAPDGKHSEKD